MDKMKDKDPGLKYELKEQIGKGSFGSAHLVVDKVTKKLYVLKRVRLARQTQWQRNSTFQEMNMMAKLSHPYIVPYIESWIHQGHTVYIVYGYCALGDMAVAINKQKGRLFEEDQLKLWMAQLLLALDYLQKMRVLHRDIKSCNIFLTAQGDVQIGDFGLATMRSGSDDDASHDQSVVGTPHYMSPEVIAQRKYSYKTDVWSLGCVMYELSALRPAFTAFNMPGLLDKIRRSNPAPLPAGLSEEYCDLIKGMLRKSVDSRPTAEELMCSPCLAKAMDQARRRAIELLPSVQLPILRPQAPLSMLCQDDASPGTPNTPECSDSATTLTPRLLTFGTEVCGPSSGGDERTPVDEEEVSCGLPDYMQSLSDAQHPTFGMDDVVSTDDVVLLQEGPSGSIHGAMETAESAPLPVIQAWEEDEEIRPYSPARTVTAEVSGSRPASKQHVQVQVDATEGKSNTMPPKRKRVPSERGAGHQTKQAVTKREGRKGHPQSQASNSPPVTQDAQQPQPPQQQEQQPPQQQQEQQPPQSPQPAVASRVIRAPRQDPAAPASRRPSSSSKPNRPASLTRPVAATSGSAAPQSDMSRAASRVSSAAHSILAEKAAGVSKRPAWGSGGSKDPRQARLSGSGTSGNLLTGNNPTKGTAGPTGPTLGKRSGCPKPRRPSMLSNQTTADPELLRELQLAQESQYAAAQAVTTQLEGVSLTADTCNLSDVVHSDAHMDMHGVDDHTSIMFDNALFRDPRNTASSGGSSLVGIASSTFVNSLGGVNACSEAGSTGGCMIGSPRLSACLAGSAGGSSCAAGSPRVSAGAAGGTGVGLSPRVSAGSASGGAPGHRLASSLPPTYPTFPQLPAIDVRSGPGVEARPEPGTPSFIAQFPVVSCSKDGPSGTEHLSTGQNGMFSFTSLNGAADTPTMATCKTLSPSLGHGSMEIENGTGTSAEQQQQQRLILLERVVQLVGRLYEAERYTELGTVISSVYNFTPQSQAQPHHTTSLLGAIPHLSPALDHTPDPQISQAAHTSFAHRQKTQVTPTITTVVEIMNGEGVVRGSVRYKGPVHWDMSGVWLGLELEIPQGMTSGHVDGIRYFSVAPNHGVFVRESETRIVMTPV